jgi:hypothetical protein
MPITNEILAYRPVFRVSDVGATPSATEYAIQGAMSLGYFELLCNGYSSSSPEKLTALKQAFDKLQSYMGQITDPTMKVLITKLMAVLAPGGTDASITADTISAYNAAMTTLDPTQSPQIQIMNWLGTSGFNFEDCVSPDTVFEATMFMASLGIGDIQKLSVGADMNAFFGQTYGVSCAAWGANFLNAYLDLNPDISRAVITEILPPDTGKAMPNYDQFLSDYNAGLPTPWPPVGETKEQALRGLMCYYEYFFNNHGK